MFKGKYILLTTEELEEKISNYVKDVGIKIVQYNENHEENNTVLLVQLRLSNGMDAQGILRKIVGNDEGLISDILFDLEYDSSNILTLNPTECSYMFNKIFDLEENSAFDDEVLYANDGLDVFLFYV